MKRKILSILFGLTVIFLGQAQDDIVMIVSNHSGPEEVYENPERRRTQPRHLECVITHDSVTVPGYDTADILAYEVYTEEGGMVASFVDEQDFIGFIFSAVGVYEIRLRFEEVTLAGFLSL